MEARELDGTVVSADGVSRRDRIMLCTQGCLLAHPVDLGRDSLHIEAQKSPFVCLARQKSDRKLHATGTLKSGKAAVILYRT